MIYIPSTQPIDPVPRPFFRAVTVEELKKPELVVAIRWTCFSVTILNGLSDTRWFYFLIDSYADLDVIIVDDNGHPVWANTEVFEASERIILSGKYPTFATARRAFFAHNCCQPPNPNARGVLPKNRVPFAVMASIVGAMYPAFSRHWPRRGTFGGMMDVPPPANDNRQGRKP